MADNINVTAGAGKTIGADEITSVLYQRVKLIEGADGTNDGDISATNPLPVELRDVDTTLVADVGAIKTAVETLDNAIAGSEMQVDVVSLPSVTGTVTANAGTNLNTSALALETGGNLATIAGKDFATETTLAALDAKVTACDTGSVTIAALPDEGQQTMANSISVAIASNQSAIPVTLTSTTVTGTVAVTQSGTWDEIGINDSGNSITVDGTVAATQSGTWNVTNVSGTVSLPTGASTLAEQQSQTTHLATIAGDTTSIQTAVELIDDTVYTDGAGTPSKGVLVLGSDGTNPQAVAVDSSGNLQVDIVSGGSAGMQYTEGDTDASITGTAILHEIANDTLATVSTTNPLPISDNGGALTVDGTVAATQSGTWNVTNVSGTVSLPTGASTLAEQQTQTASLSVIDDWDESDRAKVNIIAGQVGITAGAGAVAANTPRVTHASDDPVTTSIQLLDDAIVADDAAFTPATTKVMMAGFTYDDTSTDTVNEGDAAAARVSANRNQYVQIRDNAGNERGLNIDANGALAATVTNATAGNLNMTEANSSAIKTAVELIDNAVSGSGFNVSQLGGASVPIGAGTEAAAIRVTLPTNGTGIVGLAAGTNAVGKLAANSGVDIGDVDVTSVTPGTAATSLGKAEDAGHTSGDVGVMALGVRTDVPNAVGAGTTADYSFLATDMAGGVRTALYETDFAALGTNHVKKYYTNAGAVTDGIVWSPAAGKRWYVTDIYIQTSAAATITLEDDLSGGDSPVWKGELAANSGWSHSFQTPLFSGEDAADLLVTTSAGNVYITITGYEI